MDDTLPPLWWGSDTNDVLADAVVVRTEALTVTSGGTRMFWRGNSAAALVCGSRMPLDVIEAAYAFRALVDVNLWAADLNDLNTQDKTHAGVALSRGVIHGWEAWATMQTTHPVATCAVCESVWYVDHPWHHELSDPSISVVMCSTTCYMAWRREGQPDRLRFEMGRRVMQDAE